MFFEGISEEDLERGQEVTLYEKGHYVVVLESVSPRYSERSKAQMLAAQFRPIARLIAGEDGKLSAVEVYGTPIWNNFVLLTSTGKVNKVGASMYLQLVSALTGEGDVEALKKEYDGETLEEVGEKASLLATLRAVAYVGQRNERDGQGNPVIRNSIGSFRPVTPAEEQALLDAGIEERVPF